MEIWQEFYVTNRRITIEWTQAACNSGIVGRGLDSRCELVDILCLKPVFHYTIANIFRATFSSFVFGSTWFLKTEEKSRLFKILPLNISFFALIIQILLFFKITPPPPAFLQIFLFRIILYTLAVYSLSIDRGHSVHQPSL